MEEQVLNECTILGNRHEKIFGMGNESIIRFSNDEHLHVVLFRVYGIKVEFMIKCDDCNLCTSLVVRDAIDGVSNHMSSSVEHS